MGVVGLEWVVIMGRGTKKGWKQLV